MGIGPACSVSGERYAWPVIWLMPPVNIGSAMPTISRMSGISSRPASKLLRMVARISVAKMKISQPTNHKNPSAQITSSSSPARSLLPTSSSTGPTPASTGEEYRSARMYQRFFSSRKLTRNSK